MTEEEAKTKMCPMTFPRSGSIGERGQEDPCIGSACMAWRWSDEYSKTDLGGGHSINEPTGYCGLAGRVYGGSE